MAGWAPLHELIVEEIIERREEGCDVSGFEERVAGCANDPDKLMLLYRELRELPIRPDFPYNEPDDLEEILAQSEGNTPNGGFSGSGDELQDRMEGAWLGRCIGCAMGKPFETVPYVNGNKEGAGWQHIKTWLKGANAYPLSDYVPGKSQAQEQGLNVICPESHKENIKYMETDDDIRYLVLGLLMSELYGNNFTPEHLGKLWLDYLPASCCCTAERQAYINLLNTEISDPVQRLEYVRTWLNPYREWIGAQIRVDHYGYANAGYPLYAAKTAYQDAAFSHTKNGIYGAMYIAALIAAAFNDPNPENCIRTALTVIPKKSRLYESIHKAIDIAKKCRTEDELFSTLWETFGSYNWVHTINNAAACTAALVFGKGDFIRTISTAVSCGWDTDCNGATIGSVMGAMHGAKAIPEYLKKPLNNTLYAFIPGFHPTSITECANRSVKTYHNIHKS